MSTAPAPAPAPAAAPASSAPGAVPAPASSASGAGVDWTAVGSLGTAAGAFAALLAVGTTAVLARRQRNDTQAARIREDIRAFVVAAHALVRDLQDGAPIIAASWSARAVVQESLPRPATVQQLRAALQAGDIGLSVAVVAWERSSAAEGLRERVASMREAGRRLGGHLNLLASAGDILVGIADDARMSFLRLLNEPALVSMFLQQTQAVTAVEDLLNALCKHLHGNTAMYLVTRYEVVLRALDGFVSQSAIALGRLDSASLLAAALARSPLTGETRTGEMHMHLKALEPTLEAGAAARLQSLIDEIERGVSKEAAGRRLDDAG